MRLLLLGVVAGVILDRVARRVAAELAGVGADPYDVGPDWRTP